MSVRLVHHHIKKGTKVAANLYLSAPSEFSPSFSSRLSRPRNAERSVQMFTKLKPKIVSPSARLLTVRLVHHQLERKNNTSSSSMQLPLVSVRLVHHQLERKNTTSSSSMWLPLVSVRLVRRQPTLAARSCHRGQLDLSIISQH